jgi:hypothetical protein
MYRGGGGIKILDHEALKSGNVAKSDHAKSEESSSWEENIIVDDIAESDTEVVL